MPGGAILRRRHPRVLLEVAAEERLVGKVQPKGNLLHGEVGGAQQHLDFLDTAGVDDFLGRAAGQVLRYRREIAGGDAELVGIELHVAPGAAVPEHQVDEFLQQFLLTGGVSGFAVEELRLGLGQPIRQPTPNC